MGGADVSVDLDTGEIDVHCYVTVADVGKAINPALAEGQDEGAAMQGLGHTLFETLLYEKGQPLNANLVDYRVPRFTDLPDRFDSALVENQDGPGPYGAKGMGEPSLIPTAAAVRNAVSAALGIEIDRIPLTPPSLVAALEAAAAEAESSRR